jgi:hypothetical protein
LIVLVVLVVFGKYVDGGFVEFDGPDVLPAEGVRGAVLPPLRAGHDGSSVRASAA